MTKESENVQRPTHLVYMSWEGGEMGGSAGVYLIIGGGEKASIAELERGPALSNGFPLTETLSMPNGDVAYFATTDDPEARPVDTDFPVALENSGQVMLERLKGPEEELGDDGDDREHIRTISYDPKVTGPAFVIVAKTDGGVSLLTASEFAGEYPTPDLPQHLQAVFGLSTGGPERT